MVKTSKRTRISFNNSYCVICYKKFKQGGVIDSCSHLYCLKCIIHWARQDDFHRCPTCKKTFTTVKKKVGNKIMQRNLVDLVNNKVQFKHAGCSYQFHYEADSEDQNYNNRFKEEIICYTLTSESDLVPLEVLRIILAENSGSLWGNPDDNFSDIIDKIKNQAKEKNLDENIIYLYNVNFSIFIKPTSLSSNGASVTVIFSDNHDYFIDLDRQKS
jgi:hypothetical protein